MLDSDRKYKGEAHMETYKYEKIRNVAVLGHGGAGKTTLVEAMAYTTGIVTRQGKIEDGSTVSDYDKEEIKRQFSISTSVVPIVWEDTKINFLDTPGYFDFVGEVEEAVSACDAAVIVVSGKKGGRHAQGMGFMREIQDTAHLFCDRYGR